MTAPSHALSNGVVHLEVTERAGPVTWQRPACKRTSRSAEVTPDHRRVNCGRCKTSRLYREAKAAPHRVGAGKEG